MKTERAHYDDPLALALDVEVLERASWQGRPSMILDRTPFYPESGGQMGDHGTIGEARVRDVQIDAAGVVHHLVEGALPAAGAQARAVVDGVRRREHMALHTGQHALSRALLDALGAVTVSSRLGETACTIDVDRAGLGLDDVRRAEDAVNALIDEDRPVSQRFVDDAELETLSLRKPPPDAERVRVVEIEGFDVTPCGGTHATHTAQIELVWIYGIERYKGGTRVSFAAGPRARRLLRGESDALRALASELRCAPPEVPRILSSLRGKLDDARAEVGAVRAALADAWASALGGRGPRVVEAIDGGDPALLKAIAERLATGDRVVALSAMDPGGTHVLIARGPGASLHAGELLSRVTEARGGRGGGRPEQAQGRLPAGDRLTESDLDAT